MNKGLSAGLAGLVILACGESAIAQSGNYTQRIGSGALTPNGRTLSRPSYAIGYGGYNGAYGLGYGGYRGYSYGSAYGYNSARPAQVTWYSVANGFSTGPQTGVPWRGGGSRSDMGRDPLPESPVEGLARNRTVTGRDYVLASKLARARLATDKSNDSTALPVSSRRVESNDKKDKADDRK